MFNYIFYFPFGINKVPIYVCWIAVTIRRLKFELWLPNAVHNSPHWGNNVHLLLDSLKNTVYKVKIISFF